MDYLIQIFSTITNNVEHASWIFAITMGVAIALLGMAAFLVASGISDPVRRRIKQVSQSSTASANNNSTSKDTGKVAGPLSSYALPTKEKELSAIRTRLRHAGYRAESAMATFYSTKLLIGIGLPIIVILSAMDRWPILWGVASVSSGYVWPSAPIVRACSGWCSAKGCVSR